MKLTREDIIKLAALSRLKLTEEEIAQYQTELSSILSYVQQLEDVEVGDTKPTYQISGLTSQDSNATREDEVVDQLEHSELMKNVPDTEGRLIKVKRMVA